MAGGWTRDGAVQDQIDDTVKDAASAAVGQYAGRRGARRSATSAASRSPRPRRKALPGVRTCVACQAERDARRRSSGINRRGSKDSQLK